MNEKMKVDLAKDITELCMKYVTNFVELGIGEKEAFKVVLYVLHMNYETFVETYVKFFNIAEAISEKDMK